MDFFLLLLTCGIVVGSIAASIGGLIIGNIGGSQFTSNDFTGKLDEHGIKISMDGRDRYQDNIFVERLRWTVKYHYLYLHAFNNGTELRQGLKNWFSFYNQERFHQSLGDKTPDEVYYDRLILRAACRSPAQSPAGRFDIEVTQFRRLLADV
ncbi:MAG: transposase [Deltaproteobacteria bacterium]|nr:transposase [Candidatus Tharpella sp.]